MSSLPPDLSKFYAREQQLTASQTLARRMLVGLCVLLTVGAVVVLRWWPR